MSAALIHPGELYVLLALEDGAKHGHAIKLDIRTRTGGKVILGPGTLYGAIKRLWDNGSIREVGRDDRRRFYELTVEGRSRLVGELGRLDELLRIAHDKGLWQRN